MRRSGILLMALAIVTCLSMGCSAKREEASGYNTEVGRENTVVSKNSIFNLDSRKRDEDTTSRIAANP